MGLCLVTLRMFSQLRTLLFLSLLNTEKLDSYRRIRSGDRQSMELKWEGKCPLGRRDVKLSSKTLSSGGKRSRGYLDLNSPEAKFVKMKLSQVSFREKYTH